MKLVILFLFVLMASDCVARFFFTSKKQTAPIFILVFLCLAPSALIASSQNFDKLIPNTEFMVLCLQAFTPLILASLIFSALQVILSKSVSKDIASIAKIFRPVWLAGFVVLAVRNLAPVTQGIFTKVLPP